MLGTFLMMMFWCLRFVNCKLMLLMAVKVYIKSSSNLVMKFFF